MRYCLMILLAFGLCAAQFAAPGSGRRCVVGKSYHDGCNTCQCVNPNGGIVCTAKACFFRDEKTGVITYPEALDPPEDFWEPEIPVKC